MNSSGIGPSGGPRRTLGPRRPPPGRIGGTPGAKPSARRCLFGPVDHEETDDFLREMNHKFDKQKKERWGFDFEAGRPVPGGHPVYEWVTVGADDDIPCAYGRMGETWRGPEIVSWSNENREMRLIEGADSSPNSYRSRKRLRCLSPNNPGLGTALNSDCSNTEGCPNRGLDKAITKNLSSCSSADPVESELPPKDLRKSEKLEEHFTSDVLGNLEGSGLPSIVRTNNAETRKAFPTATDSGIVPLPNPHCSAMPDNK